MSRPSPPAPGPYLQTVSGRFVNPFDPDPEQLDPADIARALANICRFGGHCRPFYSVAQHSVIVSELVEQRGGDLEDVFAALMHDAAEAYLGDMPHPIKHRSELGAAFKAAEEHLEQAIRERFGIKDGVPEIKRADRALLATERRVFSAEQRLKALAGADHVVCVLPSDTGTDRFLDAAAIASLPERAVVYNLGRGNAIDAEALCDALHRGRVAGAFLDVVPEEPLPESSPLWRAPNLYLTPHASAIGADYLDLYIEELAVEMSRLAATSI